MTIKPWTQYIWLAMIICLMIGWIGLWVYHLGSVEPEALRGGQLAEVLNVSPKGVQEP